MKTFNQNFSSFLILNFLCVSFICFQNAEINAQASIGVNSSYLYSKIKSSNQNANPTEDDYQSKFGSGYGFAIELNYRFAPAFQLRSEFAYARRGDDLIAINAIEIPLLLVFSPEKKSGLSYQLFAGPYHGYWRSIEGKNKSKDVGRSLALVNNDNTEWGLKAGTGLRYPILADRGSIDLRITWTQGIIDGFNRGLSCSVAYLYEL